MDASSPRGTPSPTIKLEDAVSKAAKIAQIKILETATSRTEKIAEAFALVLPQLDSLRPNILLLAKGQEVLREDLVELKQQEERDHKRLLRLIEKQDHLNNELFSKLEKALKEIEFLKKALGPLSSSGSFDEGEGRFESAAAAAAHPDSNENYRKMFS